MASRARKKNVTSKDPRKPEVKAALFAKAGGGTKVTLVTEDCVDGTFSGRVMSYDANTRSWKAVGGTLEERKMGPDTIHVYDGAHTVTYVEVATVKAGGTIKTTLAETLEEKQDLLDGPTTDAEQEALADAGDPSVCSPEQEAEDSTGRDGFTRGERWAGLKRKYEAEEAEDERTGSVTIVGGEPSESGPVGHVRILLMLPGKAPEELLVKPDGVLGLLGGFHQVMGRSLFPRPGMVTVILRQFDWEGQAEAEGVSPNFEVGGHVYHGPLVAFAGNAAGDMVDLTDDHLESVLRTIVSSFARVGAQS